MFRRHRNSGGFLFCTPQTRSPDLRAVEKSAARVFGTQDGKRVLEYLQTITFHRAYGPDVPDAALRHLEGQRALVAAVLRLIERGRQ